MADLARLRCKPALAFEKRPQRLALQHDTRPAVEHVLPIDADEQRRQAIGHDGFGIALGGARAGRQHLQRGVQQGEPVRRVRPERQEVRMVADAWELGQAAHFDWDQAGECLQIELRRLHGAR